MHTNALASFYPPPTCHIPLVTYLITALSERSLSNNEPPPLPVQHRGRKGWLPLIAMAFSTLGVVYGDIGTSPIYVYSSTYPDGAPSDTNPNQLLGAFSTIFWTLTSVVLVKYVMLMLKADDNGEGGIISLYSIIKRACSIPTLTSLHSVEDDLHDDDELIGGKKPSTLLHVGIIIMAGVPSCISFFTTTYTILLKNCR